MALLITQIQETLFLTLSLHSEHHSSFKSQFAAGWLAVSHNIPLGNTEGISGIFARSFHLTEFRVLAVTGGKEASVREVINSPPHLWCHSVWALSARVLWERVAVFRIEINMQIPFTMCARLFINSGTVSASI